LYIGELVTDQFDILSRKDHQAQQGAKAVTGNNQKLSLYSIKINTMIDGT